MLVRRKDGVKDMLDRAGAADQREPFQEPLADFALLLARLGAQAENIRSHFQKFRVVIAKAARLRRATARTGNLIPAGRKRNAGTTSKRVSVNNRESPPFTKIDLRAGSGKQRDVRECRSPHSSKK